MQELLYFLKKLRIFNLFQKANKKEKQMNNKKSKAPKGRILREGKIKENKKKILYEGKFRKIGEIESDHIHLDDGTVIKNNEIIKISKNIWISTFSEKKEIKNILKGFDKIKNKLKYLKE